MAEIWYLLPVLLGCRIAVPLPLVPDVLAIDMRLPPLVVAMLAENGCDPLAQRKVQCAADGSVTANGFDVLVPVSLKMVRVRYDGVVDTGLWRTAGAGRCTAAVGAVLLFEAANPVMMPATAARPRMPNRASFLLLFDRRG